jgi:hypothetical protein
LFQTLTHFVVGNPRIGIETFGIGFQLFLLGRVRDSFGDPGEDLGIAGTEPQDAFGAKPPVRCRRFLNRFLFFPNHFLFFRDQSPLPRNHILFVRADQRGAPGFRSFRYSGLSRLFDGIGNHDRHALAWTRAGAPLDEARLLFRSGLAFQNSRPVELDVRIVFLDQFDCAFVESGATDLDAWRRPKPIEDPGSCLSAAPIGVDDERILVAALVAAETKVRQGYFLFWARDAFRAGVLARLAREGALRLASGALRFFVAAERLAGLGTSAGARWTSVNRVWSPIVW